MLVRPDGFVVWASNNPLDCTKAEQALSQWLMSPRQAKADLTTRCPF
ncbi:aromatic-ring hydroxylase C-terminal domain-containing protein [Tanticharoenia sakaeratensis]